MSGEAFYQAELLKKYLTGALSPEELLELKVFMEESPSFRNLVNELSDEKQLSEKLQIVASIDSGAAWAKIQNEVVTQQTPKQFWIYFRSVAAALVLVGIYLIYQYAYINKRYTPKALSKVSELPEKLPESSLVLRLGDGKELSLENADQPILFEGAGYKIIHSTEQGLAYQQTSRKEGTAIYEQHSLITPIGKTYQVKLSDGTKVWLNAKSTLTYPEQFSGAKREVKLVGEAYFEVFPNREAPFIVTTAKGEINVLGTHFNVMAYPEDQDERTTLVEGSVEVIAGKEAKIIRPGQQAQITDQLVVKQVKTKEVVSWKSGFFYFENENLTSIMRQLKRWYGVEFEGGNTIPKLHFSASISRDTPLPQLLKLIEMSGNIKFHIEGNTITVTKN